MAFISEVNFRGTGAGEFVEIALGPNDDPADFVVSAYNQNGALWPASGIAGGEVNLSTLTGTPDPESPGFTIYVIPVGIRNANSDSNEASGIALTDISTGGGVIDFYSADDIPAITATEGAALGATSDDILEHLLTPPGESYQWDIFGNLTFGPTTSGNAVLCLTADCTIKTQRGEARCGDLQVGDHIWTLDNGYQPIRWIGVSTMTARDFSRNEKLRPIQIAADALAPGVPTANMVVSPQHRILVQSIVAARMFGQDEVFVSARRLLSLPAVEALQFPSPLTYVHLLLEHHQIISANGALVESLLMADQSHAAIQNQRFVDSTGTAMPDHLRALAQQPCRPVIEGRRSKRLIERLLSNGKPVQMDHATGQNTPRDHQRQS